jgi:excisionase family DNA binding protein
MNLDVIDLDDDWRDTLTPDGVAELRRRAARPAYEEKSPEPPTVLAGEVRRLASQIELMRAALPPLLATIPDAAEILGLSVSTVRRGVKDGSIPSRRFGQKGVRVDLTRCRGLDSTEIAQLARAARSGR